MKIASYYGRPSSYVTGGVLRSRHDWMTNFARVGHEVSVIDAAGGASYRSGAAENLARVELRHFGRRRWSMIPLGLGAALRNVDLLYLHEGWTMSNLIAFVVARSRGVHVAFMPHGVYESAIVDTLRRVPFRQRLERWVLDRALFVHVFLPGEVAEVEKVAPASRVLTAPTGFLRNAETWRPSGEPYLAWAARYDVHHKGIDLLLNAMASVPPGSRPTLRMVGPDHNGGLGATRALVSQLGLEASVSVEGPLAPPALTKFVAESVGFVHTPRWECLGRSVVDALLVGVPVLVSEDAQIGEVLAQAEVAVVTSTEPESLARALCAIWSDQSPDLAASGQRWAETYFDWDVSLAAWARQADGFIQASGYAHRQ